MLFCWRVKIFDGGATRGASLFTRLRSPVASMLLQTLPCASPAVFARRRARVSRSSVCSAVKDDTARVSSAFKATFAQHAAHVSRAYESWARMARGDPMYECSHPGQGLQQATGYVDGLTAVAFHEASACAPWMRVLEAQVGVIQGELRAALSPESAAAVARNGSNVWSPAARADAMSYGPQWKTLGLQDRSQWDAAQLHPHRPPRAGRARGAVLDPGW